MTPHTPPSGPATGWARWWPAPLLAATLALLWTCSFGVDPEQARFHCDGGTDCGSGFECRPQASGGLGLCYRDGECFAESCDTQDNDCDGVVDNGFDLQVDPLNCGACGTACGAGTTCRAGHCVETRCGDGSDDDGDGETDCDDSDCVGVTCGTAKNCGKALVVLDGGAGDGGVDGGEPVAGCVDVETVCGDGLDDDLDGKTDCADADCAGHAPCP